MIYSVTVKYQSLYPDLAKQWEWAEEHGIKVKRHEWRVINDQQHMTFYFEREADVTAFALKWK